MNNIYNLIVQSLTPSLKNFKRGSVTSASTIAEDESPYNFVKQRRHSEISRTLMGISHECPERNYSFSSGKNFLERTNSAGSLKISLYKDPLKNSKHSNNNKSHLYNTFQFLL